MAIKQLAGMDALQQYIKPPSPRDIQEVVLHHTWSPTAAQYRGKMTWDAIRNYHMGTRGWSDIGYHFGIGPDPDLSLWALRPYSRSGAHVLNRNAYSLGIALIGNYDAEDPTGILPTAAEVVRALCDRFEIGAGGIRFHREFADKTCPGTRVGLTHFRRLVMGMQVPKAEDTQPNIPTLAVVLGGNIVPCEPRLVGGRLTVDAVPFFNALDPEWALGFEYPGFVHADTGRMFIHEAAPWFKAHGWVIGGEVWRTETLPGRLVIKRLYPQRVEWLEGGA